MKTKKSILVFLICACISCMKNTNTNAKQQFTKINKELVTELNKMIELDQYVSGMPQGKYEGDWQGWFKYRDSVSKVHKIRLESILDEYGFPGHNLVGEDVSHNYWNMVQHCDFDVAFQQKALIALEKEVQKNNARPSDIGFLTDRIQVNLNKPQVYGTQLDYNMSICKVYSKGSLIDSINVDKRRHKLKMKPYKTYLNEMLKMHFEANKSHYSKIGITEPTYY